MLGSTRVRRPIGLYVHLSVVYKGLGVESSVSVNNIEESTPWSVGLCLCSVGVTRDNLTTKCLRRSYYLNSRHIIRRHLLVSYEILSKIFV